MTLRLSWSGLRTHEECKQKGYLTRTRKRAVLADQRNFFPGNVTDRTVRDWLNTGDPQPGQLATMVEHVMDRERNLIIAGDPEKGIEPGVMKWRDSADQKKVYKECVEAVTKIEPLLLKYVTPFEYQPDFRFEAPLKIPHPHGGAQVVSLIGVMDILVRDNKGRFWVFDVKHTRDDSYWRKTIGQLTFYDLAVELMFNQATAGTALFQPLCKRPAHPHKVDAQARAELLQRFVGFARDIWLDDRSPKPTRAGCDWCDVKHACTVFQPVVDSNGNKRVSF